MRVYVAAKFTEKEQVKSVYQLLQQAGHLIAQDWTKNSHLEPFSEHRDYTAHCAKKDMDGVLDADVFILLTSAELSPGASSELGAAIGVHLIFKKPDIYVVGPHFNNYFFSYHPAVMQKNSIQEVLACLANEEQDPLKIQEIEPPAFL